MATPWKFAADVSWDGKNPAMKARAGKHEFILDEPASGGGTDKGPNQLQYLLGALAGCYTAMARFVASEMGLKIDSMSCRAEAELNPDGLLDKDPKARPGFSSVTLTYKFESKEPADKLAIWIEKTNKRCPVKDIFEHPTPIKVVKG